MDSLGEARLEVVAGGDRNRVGELCAYPGDEVGCLIREPGLGANLGINLVELRPDPPLGCEGCSARGGKGLDPQRVEGASRVLDRDVPRPVLEGRSPGRVQLGNVMMKLL